MTRLDTNRPHDKKKTSSDPPFAGYVRQLSNVQQLHSMLHEMDTCTKPDSMYGQTVSGILLPSKPRFPCNVINAVIATQLIGCKGTKRHCECIESNSQIL